MSGFQPETNRSSRWSDLQARILSSIVIVCVAAFCLWQGGWAYSILILAVMAGLVWEGESLLGQNMCSWRGVLFVLWPVCVGLVLLKGQVMTALYLALGALFFGWRTYGPLLVAMVGGVALLWLRQRAHGMAEVLFVIAVVVASDSCAYMAGRLLGGPKLAPAISPGKTVSGAVGGLCGAVLAAVLVSWGVSRGISFSVCVCGGVLGIVSQLGDLLESSFKRRLGVKDSGRLIPGHGGLLDRFDGLLAAGPVAACLALMSGSQPFWTVLGG